MSPHDHRLAVRRAHLRALAKAAGWLVLLPFLLMTLGGAGYVAVDEFSRARLRAAGPPVTADVMTGIPGEHERLIVLIDDRFLKVDVRSWRGAGPHTREQVTVVVDPDRPGDPDDPFGPDFYGRAVLAVEPDSVAAAVRRSAALLGLFAALVAVVSLNPVSPRTVLAVLRDRRGVPGLVVEVMYAAKPPATWRRVLVSAFGGRTRYPFRYADATVDVPGGRLVVPVLLRGTEVPRPGAAVSVVGAARPGGRGVVILDEPPAGTSRALWSFRAGGSVPSAPGAGPVTG